MCPRGIGCLTWVLRLLPSGNTTVAVRKCIKEAHLFALLCMHLPRQQARAEGLTLLVGENKTGYLGVRHEPKSKRNPYRAQVRRSGKIVSLGSFATAEEAALCVARTPERQAAAQRPVAAPPLQPSPAPPATARRTAPPPRRWRSCPGAPSCHHASPAPCRGSFCS